ncbi:MAG: site-specific DNA-methyltransferase (adenine-specific) [Bacillota bacterium]|nr:MAG: site-specific DNA-methyltransferase (adenine-specific) [Bacillota bacterium]
MGVMHMREEIRQQVIELLQGGQDLPPELALDLFPPEKRECELVWPGKQRAADVMTETIAVPLQPVSVFGKNAENWSNMLVFGDNIQVMKTLVQMKEKGQLVNADGTPGARLIYIDPPFASNKEYKGTSDQKAYQDKLLGTKFIDFLRKRLILMRELLSDDGTICVHLDWKKGHYVKVLMDEVFDESNFRNEMVWHYSGWNKRLKSNFNRRWDGIYVYSKGPEPLFNAYTVPWESKDAYVKARKQEVHREDNGREYVLSDGGGGKRVRRFLEEAMEDGRPIDDVWDLDKLNNSSKESVGYPTQKPEALLERIISSWSKRGDIVVDAFAGSGTTCAVSEKLGRRWIAIDCGKLSIYTIQKRMLNLNQEIGNKGDALTTQPFTLYNAGLYDFSSLQSLKWDDWRFFALQLFGCKDERHIIGGLLLDGKLRGNSVLVFNHTHGSKRRVSEETIDDLHLHLGKSIGTRLYIIAPRGAFDFQQDYIDRGPIRYYALRIPYSMIRELHSRDFKALLQPNQEALVNDLVEAVGFDFIQPPLVEWVAGTEAVPGSFLRQSFIQIVRFESRVGKGQYQGWEAFSMLMLDIDYDGEVFAFDKVFYAHQLAAENWKAALDPDTIGQNIMAVFLDIYGNESRIVVSRSEFGLE